MTQKKYFVVASRCSFLRVIFRCELFGQSFIKLEAHECFMIKGTQMRLSQMCVWSLIKVKLHKLRELKGVEQAERFAQKIRDCTRILLLIRIFKFFVWILILKISLNKAFSLKAEFFRKINKKCHAIILLLFFGDCLDLIRFLEQWNENFYDSIDDSNNF